MRGELLIASGIALVFIGFMLIFIGTLLLASSGETDVEGGGIIMIGPIPIVFGTSRGVLIVSILAVLLMVLWIVASLIQGRG